MDLSEQANPGRGKETMEEVAIVAVPFPMQGHLNQLLHFSLRLASLGFPVHFAASPTHIRQAKERIHGWNSTSLGNIHFHALHVPPIPSPPPDPNSSANFPNHLVPAFHASLDLQPPLRSLLRSLSAACRRLVVVHDPLVPSAGREAAEIPNAESYRFQCVPTFNELAHVFDPNSSCNDKVRPEILEVIVSQLEGSMTNEAWGFFARLDFEPRESGTLFNTCRAIEGEFFDVLAATQRHHGKKLFAVGPVNPMVVVVEKSRECHPCLEWLDKQPSGSVVYVSFGSSTTLSDAQVEQLAVGLKSSGQRFIWILRDADRGDIYSSEKTEEDQKRKLPPGFEEETADVGVVVRGWAPQLEILAHPSTGAFVSHCGWNSCLESLSMGVPIIAWPMHSDQPRNAIMITKYLKCGITVREWSRRDEVISGEEIGEVIKRMMVSDEGKEMRKRAQSIGEQVRSAVSEGGSSKADLDSFTAHIRRP